MAVYQIMVCVDERWSMLASRRDRDDANSEAAKLQGHEKYDRIQLRDGDQVLAEFEGGRGRNGPVTIAFLEKMPIWREPGDAFGIDSRLAIGRLLRKYLDQHVLTPSELLHHGGHLRMLVNQDQLYYQAVARIAQLQAASGNRDEQQVAKVIHTTFDDLKDLANSFDNTARYREILDAKGLGPALHFVGKEIPQEHQTWFGRLLLTLSTGQAGEWRGKLVNLLALAENAPGPKGMGLIDEGLAEIMDGGRALNDVLGRQKSLADALHCMVAIGHGKYTGGDELLQRINNFCNSGFAKELPAVLCFRAEKELRGTNPLVKDPKADPTEALIKIIDGVVADDGVQGGASMAEALAERTRITVKDGYNDLSMPQAIDAVTNMTADPAAKLNFNLDIAHSDAGRENQKSIANNINKTIDAVEDASELLPAGAAGGGETEAYDKIRDKLADSGLPDKVTQVLDSRLEAKAADCESLPDRGKADPGKPPEKENRRTVKKDTYLFYEGDGAEEVYLIANGKVAILKEQDTKPKLIAMLGRGQILGEMALIDDAPRSASAKAMEDTELVVIKVDAFQERLERLNKVDPVMRRLMNVFVDRLRSATDK